MALKWLSQAPASAPGAIFSTDPANPVMKASALVAAGSVVHSDPLKFLEGGAQLPLEASAADSLRLAAFNELASRNPDALLNWTSAHPGATVPPEATAAAVKLLAGTDLTRALQWVRQSATPAERGGLLAGVFGNWVRSDRDAALEFLKSMPAGKEREATMSVLLDADLELSRNDTFFAANLLPDCFAYALQFTGDEERIKALRRVLQCMKQMEVSAEKVMNHPNLRAADRAALMKNS